MDKEQDYAAAESRLDSESAAKASSKAAAASSEAALLPKISYDTDTYHFAGYLGQTATIKFSFKNVGNVPINGARLGSVSLSTKYLTLNNLSDSGKTEDMNNYSWDKVIQPGESYEVDISLIAMETMTNKNFSFSIEDGYTGDPEASRNSALLAP